MASVVDEIRQEMLSYDSCLISDVLERLQLPFGIASLKRLTTRARIFGAAVTVTLETFRGDVPKRHLGTAAIDDASKGDIIVVQHHSRGDCAGWGGLLSTAAVARGISGVVVDGLARDIDECEELAFPVFARDSTPVTARNRVMETATGEPVTIGGLVVNPGNLILADGSGVVVIPQARAMDVMEAARAMLSAENAIRRKIQDGQKMTAAMNESYEKLLQRKGSS